VRQRSGQEAQADEESDHEHTCHNDVIVPGVRPLAQVVLSFISIMQADGWLGLELRHLVALRAVAEEGSFGRAATHLGYTQSAVSQQIASLERIVGQKLLERPGGPKPVSLTEAGTLLLRHADAITARLSAAQADLGALRDGEAGPLRVGTYQSVSAKLLPALLRDVHAVSPNTEVHLTESADDLELLTLVEQGELDLAFVALPIRPGPFELVELLRDPHVLLVQADSPLAARDRAPTLRELAELPLISWRNCRITQSVEERLHVGGREPRILFRSDDNGTVQALVSAGHGVAIVPRLTVDRRDRSVVMIDLGDRIPARTIAIAWHRDRVRTRAAEWFVEAAQTLCTRFDERAAAA